MRERQSVRAERVGYKRPPTRTQFKSGRSGNPAGRPKGTLNLKSDLEAELKAPMLVREEGKTTRLSKQRVAIKVLVDKALKGDLRAIGLLVTMLERHLPPPAAPAADERSDDKHDWELLQQALRRLEGEIRTRSQPTRKEAKP